MTHVTAQKHLLFYYEVISIGPFPANEQEICIDGLISNIFEWSVAHTPSNDAIHVLYYSTTTQIKSEPLKHGPSIATTSR